MVCRDAKSDDPLGVGGVSWRRNYIVVSARISSFHVVTPKVTTLTVDAGCGDAITN